ncbi:hypothetical protein LCGC14_1228140 [marine sediment metagenome]|uniref:Uncharacterized protein n=1 Tax=marine sediment metagenome TaxID=412755 RepID=A0A0F9NRK7_9ZZZZ
MKVYESCPASGGNAITLSDTAAAIVYVSVVPEPGAICPTCHEKTPTKHALEMRKWRARKKRG